MRCQSLSRTLRSWFGLGLVSEDEVSISVSYFEVLVSEDEVSEVLIWKMRCQSLCWTLRSWFLKMRRKSLSWFLIPILRCEYPRPRFGCNLPSHSPTLPSPL